MDRLGFIHEELDIKILILFVLRRLPGVVDPTYLSDLCRECDIGVGYFDYSDCLADLIDNGLVAESAEGFQITEKGAKNVEIVETSIPYSVRKRAEKLLARGTSSGCACCAAARSTPKGSRRISARARNAIIKKSWICSTRRPTNKEEHLCTHSSPRATKACFPSTIPRRRSAF